MVKRIPYQVPGTIVDLDCNGIIFVLSIKELHFPIPNDGVLNSFIGLCLTL
jgi:hypothetical protein